MSEIKIMPVMSFLNSILDFLFYSINVFLHIIDGTSFVFLLLHQTNVWQGDMVSFADARLFSALEGEAKFWITLASFIIATTYSPRLASPRSSFV